MSKRWKARRADRQLRHAIVKFVLARRRLANRDLYWRVRRGLGGGEIYELIGPGFRATVRDHGLMSWWEAVDEILAVGFNDTWKIRNDHGPPVLGCLIKASHTILERLDVHARFVEEALRRT